ncbi:IS21-like element helper ATPase IstB [Lentzea sp. NPDC102401]
MSVNESAPQMSEARRYQQLRAHFSYLKLDNAAEALPRVLDEVRHENLSMTAALERLLEIEVNATEARRLAGRLRFACLPDPWTLSDFDFAAQPGVDEKLIRDLATLRFLDDASNVLFVGPPGVGKTMLTTALARGAAEAGHRVYFTTAADLAARCHKAAVEGRWATCMRFFAGPKLLVIDELGYLPLPGDGASALFQVINQRYLKSSTILTTNVGIADWATAFGDATVAAAMLDRLLHRATVVGINGPSYRLRSHQSTSDKLRKAVNACLLTPLPRLARSAGKRSSRPDVKPRPASTAHGNANAPPRPAARSNASAAWSGPSGRRLRRLPLHHRPRRCRSSRRNETARIAAARSASSHCSPRPKWHVRRSRSLPPME